MLKSVGVYVSLSVILSYLGLFNIFYGVSVFGNSNFLTYLNLFWMVGIFNFLKLELTLKGGVDKDSLSELHHPSTTHSLTK